jgi:hypothetical protein
MLARYSSSIRTGCANERPSGSVRGAPGNRCPYRDRQLEVRFILPGSFNRTGDGIRTSVESVSLATHWHVSPLRELLCTFLI